MTVKVCCGCGWGRDLRVRQSAQRDGSCWSAPSPDPQSRIWWPVTRPWNRGHTPLASAGLYFLGGSALLLLDRLIIIISLAGEDQCYFTPLVTRSSSDWWLEKLLEVLWPTPFLEPCFEKWFEIKKFGIGSLKFIFWIITSARASSIKKYKFLKSTRVVWDDGTTP